MELTKRIQELLEQSGLREKLDELVEQSEADINLQELIDRFKSVKDWTDLVNYLEPIKKLRELVEQPELREELDGLLELLESGKSLQKTLEEFESMKKLWELEERLKSRENLQDVIEQLQKLKISLPREQYFIEIMIERAQHILDTEIKMCPYFDPATSKCRVPPFGYATLQNSQRAENICNDSNYYKSCENYEIAQRGDYKENLAEHLQQLKDSPLQDLIEKAQKILDEGIKIGKTVIYTIRTETQDDWVYFSNYSDYMRLYKIRTDGTDMQKLNDEKSYDISVMGEWIYYVNSEDRKHYKIRTDGTERQSRW